MIKKSTAAVIGRAHPGRRISTTVELVRSAGIGNDGVSVYYLKRNTIDLFFEERWFPPYKNSSAILEMEVSEKRKGPWRMAVSLLFGCV